MWRRILPFLKVYCWFIFLVSFMIYCEDSVACTMNYYRGFNGYAKYKWHSSDGMGISALQRWINATENSETAYYYSAGIDAHYNAIHVPYNNFMKTWNEANNIAYTRSLLLPQTTPQKIYEAVVDVAYVLWLFFRLSYGAIVMGLAYVWATCLSTFFLMPVAWISLLISVFTGQFGIA